MKILLSCCVFFERQNPSGHPGSSASVQFVVRRSTKHIFQNVQIRNIINVLYKYKRHFLLPIYFLILPYNLLLSCVDRKKYKKNKQGSWQACRLGSIQLKIIQKLLETKNEKNVIKNGITFCKLIIEQDRQKHNASNNQREIQISDRNKNSYTSFINTRIHIHSIYI